MNKVFLGLGSNKPWNSMDCYAILKNAIIELGVILNDIHSASFYETEPIPKSAQNNFINTVVSGFFPGVPDQLLNLVNQTEAMFGRDRPNETRWGERSLDIDILLFGNIIMSTPNLIIPHPRLEERCFALEPLLELWPKAYSPLTGVSYCKICSALPDQGVKKILADYRRA